MPELKLSIGERDFEVACQEGEENFLTEAANLLNAESQKLVSQLGRLSESRMLLMAGLYGGHHSIINTHCIVQNLSNRC